MPRASVCSIALPPTPEALSTLNAWYADQIASADLPPRVVGDMKLCLNELVTNVISYAFRDQPAPQLSVTLHLAAPEIRAEIVDNGLPFDPLAVPEAPPLDDLETAPIGGFGIKLVRETARALRYERVEGENRLSFTCRPPRQGAAPAP